MSEPTALPKSVEQAYEVRLESWDGASVTRYVEVRCSSQGVAIRDVQTGCELLWLELGPTGLQAVVYEENQTPEICAQWPLEEFSRLESGLEREGCA